MPAAIEKKIRARGGALRYRTQYHGRGRKRKLFRVAVVRKKGPRGGRTIEWPFPDHMRPV
jgi:hypothetical protein